MEPMDLLADTRRSLADAIRQLAAIEAGAPIAKPLTREQAINIVTEQIGLFEKTCCVDMEVGKTAAQPPGSVSVNGTSAVPSIRRGMTSSAPLVKRADMRYVRHIEFRARLGGLAALYASRLTTFFQNLDPYELAACECVAG